MRDTHRQHIKTLPLFDFCLTEPQAQSVVVPETVSLQTLHTDLAASESKVQHESTDTEKAIVTIQSIIPKYKDYLSTNCKSEHTIKSFCADIRRFALYVGVKSPSEIDIYDLRSFIVFMKEQGDQPKTTARRQSSLKNFFRWLFREEVIPSNPGEQLIFTRAVPPLPDILTGEEADRFNREAQNSPLEQLLAMFLLGAGLKRNEILDLGVSDIDISNPHDPVAMIRGKDRSRARNINLPLDIIEPLRSYLDQRKPEDNLFGFTDRHLNNILYRIAQRAGIAKKVSCQILRDTFATRCLKAGESVETVLGKLGLADSTMNEETKEKYRKLAEITA